MKKIIIMLMFSCFVAITVNGQGIKFEENLSWKQIKEKAVSEKKNIFIDFYTSWCIPCKAMDENIYPLNEVGDFFNKQFISIRVQMDTNQNDNKQTKLWRSTAEDMGKKYSITSYPTMYFVNSSGDPLMKIAGMQTASGLVQVAKIALDTNSSFVGLYRQYLFGNRKSDLVLKLVETGKALGQQDQVRDLGQTYLAGLSKSELFEKDNLLIMDAVMRSVKDVGFNIFLNQPDKVISKFGERFSASYLRFKTRTIIYDELITPNLYSQHGNPDWSKITKLIKPFGNAGKEAMLFARYFISGRNTMKKVRENKKPVLQPILDRNNSWVKTLSEIKDLNYGMGEELLVGASIVYYMNNLNNNYENFYQSAKYYDQHFRIMLAAQSLNDWAWISFEHTSDPIKLEEALSWSRRSMDLTPGQANYMDTYANLLYRLGSKQKAIEWEEKAILAQPQNADFQLALDRMKKNEKTWPSR